MDNYDPLIIDIRAPLIIVNLEASEENTEYIKSQLSPINLANKQWDNSILKNRLLSTQFLINFIENPHDILNKLHLFKEPEKHSTLSPFNVKSDLFPNGILSHHWFEKYQSLKPFCFIKVYDLEDETHIVDDINSLKKSFEQFDIKFTAIVLNSSDNYSEDSIDNLRLKTNLNRTSGLLYINCNLKNFHKELEFVITGLLSNLKTPAIEFYKRIELKIKQRNKKYYSIPSSVNIDTSVELVPKFLETRNLIKLSIIHQYLTPHNLEGSIGILEQAYEDLILIVHENFFEFSKDALSQHDKKLYSQFRSLIDAVAFNLVRAYLSIEDPILALKKHALHILSVVSATRGRIDSNQWISVQYEWLAQLLQLVPRLILADINVKSYAKRYKNSKLIRYWGGIRFTDENLDIILDPGLLYLKCASYLDSDIIPEANQLDFLSLIRDVKQQQERRILLLEKASQVVGSTSYSKHINFLIAEEYWEMEKWESAIPHYRKALGSWDSANDFVKDRLITCYEKLGDGKNALNLLLLILGQCDSEPLDIKALSDVSFTESLFDVSALLADEKACNGDSSSTIVFDTVKGQLELKPRVVADTLVKYIKGDDVQIEHYIESIKVNFNNVNGLQDITITHEPSNSSQLQRVENGKADLSFDSLLSKIVEFSQVAEKSGSYSIKEVHINSYVIIKFNGTQLTIKNHETVDTFPKRPYSWFYKQVDDKLISVPIKVSDSNVVKVLPIQPNLMVNMIAPQMSTIVLGERANLKFDIEIKNDRKLNYDQVSLSPRVKVITSGSGDVSMIDCKVCWEGLKDDEALTLDNLDSSETRHVTLNVSVHSTSLLAEEQLRKSSDSYQMVLELNTLVVELSETDVVSYDTADYTFPILNSPFQTGITISPRYRETDENVNDIPNPLILHEPNHLSMPIVTRIWQSNLSIANKADSISIDSITFNIKSKNPEIFIDLVDSPSDTQQLFTTRSKNGISHRNVTMAVSVNINWKRNDIVNTFISEDWEIVIPLSDPRVLMRIEKMEEKHVRLKYVIENPTPRIFTFSSKLIDDNERFIWNFSLEKNMMPLVQPRFPVLPFNRFHLDYEASYNSTDDIIELPQLKVFDLQYKVSLPTLPVTGDIVSKDGKLLWKVNSL